VFPSDGSVNRRLPWLLTGFRGSVSLLSDATMEALRLPWPVSRASLRSARDTSSCLARSLTPTAKRSLGCRDVGRPVPSFVWPIRRGDRRLSQVPREPSCTSALLLDPGRTLARGVGRSGAAPADIKAKAPAIRIFRGSITRLLCSLPTLEAAISGDSPRLASGWWPPFPGGALVPPRGSCKEFPHSITSLLPFFLDFAWRYMSDPT
jgi:hypothetical protein